MARITPDCCPKDCPRRAVGCRTDCLDWAEHERRKAERYAAAAVAGAGKPQHEAWKQDRRKKLRKQLRR